MTRADHEPTVPTYTMGPPIRDLAIVVASGPDAGKRVEGPGPLSIGTAASNDLVLSDPTVSRFHVELARDADRIRVTDCDSTNGTFVGPVHLQRASVRVPAGVELRIGATAITIADGSTVSPSIAVDRLGPLRGSAPAMQALYRRLDRVAAADASVLLLGETGTGKEVVARAVYELGRRRDRPFVVVDCGALAPNLVASELFGHEKGAFTGAERRHVGAFERANGGTIFLDEIGELPTELQPALLGALERRRIRRVGGREEVPVDVRVISATHRDLRGEVNRGSFRPDLYYRLAVITMHVPPLRERTSDIPILVAHFAQECGYEGPLEDAFSEADLARLEAYTWPGNVRELRNIVEATVALGELPAIDGSQAPPPPAEGADVVEQTLGLPYREARDRVMADFQARYVKALLVRAGTNLRQAARVAGLDRNYLSDMIKRYRRPES